jgi:type VI secretion system secreted protein Hcp
MKTKTALLLGLLILAVGLMPARTQAAVDMFLKLGDVKGESKDRAHAGEIEVLAWSWGMSQSGTTHQGGGAGAGKASFQDISITKYLDTATTPLMQALAKGTHFGKVVLTFRSAGEAPIDFIKIELEEVLVTSLSTGGSGGEDRFTENISLNFAKVKVTYTPKTSKGPTPDKPTFSWNISENSAP